ncbi:MAG TPA: molybdate ABC transporter substrate-binding protein [Pirellulales bacterium]|nr:molybdate ABC transporter substrate-binding protein [Pirellulales bacterium]
MLRPRYFVWSTVALFALLFCACTQQQPPGATKEPLIVSAAASTKEIMEAVATQFQSETGTEVKVNVGPSSGLAAQIEAGAPADLFLSANQQWADEVLKAGYADAMTRLLTNQLVLVVPNANLAGVKQPQDLLSAKVKKIALAGEKVPAGIYADQALTKLDLLKPLTDMGKIVRGQDVRTALTYVERGEAEAGIVYSTDVSIAPAVTQVYQFDPKLHDEIVYMLVLLKHGSQNPAAKQLFEFLQSPKADAVYTKFGFSRLPDSRSAP